MTKLIKNLGMRVFGVNAIAYGISIPFTGFIPSFTSLIIHSSVAIFTAKNEIKNFIDNNEKYKNKIK